MPILTLLTSAPTASHILAISFINEILVASIAFAEYFVISALAISIKIIVSLFRTIGRYSSFIMSAAFSLSVPIIIRSGFKQSDTAVPSFKNSGLDITSNVMLLPLWSSPRWIISLTLPAVPTGTVDLLTTYM